MLTYITANARTNVPDYRGIGSSGIYGNVFLKPLYLLTDKVTMYQFGKIGYFIIRFLEKFEIDDRVGGIPQIWFVPNSGELFTLTERPEWMKDYDTYSNETLENFQKQILNIL